MRTTTRTGGGGRDFGRSSGGGGRSFGGRSPGRSSGGRGGYGDRDGGRPEMFQTVCDECGKSCEVPFRPSGEKPVYCSECFEQRGGNERNDRGRDDRGGRSNDRSSGGGSGVSKEQFDSLNSKLDQILKALSRVVPRETGDLNPETGEPTFELDERKTVRAEETEE